MPPLANASMNAAQTCADFSRDAKARLAAAFGRRQKARSQMPTSNVRLLNELDNWRGEQNDVARTRASVYSGFKGLTFDMSGGPKGAKRPLGRPLDGGVRPPLGRLFADRTMRKRRCVNREAIWANHDEPVDEKLGFPS